MISAGSMRHYATFFRPVRTTTATGEVLTAYEEDFSAFCSFVAVRGKMIENVRQVAPEASHTIKLQYMPDRELDESRRVQIEGNIYEILFVDDVKLMGRVWELQVKQYKGAYGDQTGY